MQTRGFTLIELMVGTAVGVFITLVGLSFVVQQTQVLGTTSELIELTESSRFGVDRLTEDLRMAGVGVGYTEAGDFAGLASGTFQVGEATFISDNRVLHSGARTDDLGILSALGGRISVSRYDDAGVAEVCRGSTFRVGERIVFSSEDGLTARSAVINDLAPTTCMGDDCVGGCDTLLFAADPTYVAGPSASTAQYAGGTASGQLEWITWFVEDGDGTPHLRRAAGPCHALDATCGEVVADNVETLQVRRWLNRAGVWTDITTTGVPADADGRIRIDIELVIRAHSPGKGVTETVQSTLDRDLCFPTCGQPTDGFVRRRVATSVEIKNAGRGRYRRKS